MRKRRNPVLLKKTLVTYAKRRKLNISPVSKSTSVDSCMLFNILMESPAHCRVLLGSTVSGWLVTCLFSCCIVPGSVETVDHNNIT